MSDTHDNEMVEFASQASPGIILKHERERQGMSIEEAAVALNLRPAVVIGLESDRYEEVPVSAYRRGYLRAYSRMLGIDEKSVIAAYNTQFGGDETDRKVTPVHVTRPPSRIGAWLFKLVTLLVVVGLIGLTLLWWQSRGGNELLGLGGSEPVAVDTLDGTTITEGDESPPAGEPLPPLPADSGEMGLVDDRQPAEPTPAAPGDPTVDDSVAVAPVETDTATEAGNIIASTPPLEQPGSQQPVANEEAVQEEEAPATEQPAAADPRVLELTFNEQSWTEIFDASNQRVFVGLQEPGTQATAEGQPPFRLTIGNASGVELRYRGEQVDLTARAGTNNVARFTLGE
ncbi:MULTISPECIES: RodZ domain-containing protein [Halomonadaceae]|uniref:RodZ domain-containing protein n=1 Tax=Halomonadaceae TaxID=28256 RepID=UPI0015982153|nr:MULTISPECIES: RodZ domain-containing protein [Halomonas]QJQ94485.1 DUF4115 domain-containing protein [Halomonas sp. PA5]